MYLSDEGGVVAVAKVNRQNILSELFNFFDYKSLSSPGPTDDIRELIILNRADDTSNIS